MSGDSNTTLGTFSEKRYAVPFGRYVGSPEVQPPADEVLVGREGQAAYLIDLLISTGRRGAYLVTGRRGTGKTSFVKHCINEYEDSVFSRFLRANVGRGFWDRALVLLFWSALLLGALVLSELVQLLIPATPTKDVLPWVALVPLGIAYLYPCVYAKVVLETIIRNSASQPNEASKENQFLGLIAGAFVFALITFFWVFLPHSGEPATTSLLIPVICGAYLFAQAVSLKRPESSPGRHRSLHRLLRNTFLIVYLALVTWVAWGSMNLKIAERFRAHLGLGLALLGIGYLLRGFHQRSLRQLVVFGDKKEREYDLHESFVEAMLSGSNWYLLAGLGLFFTGFVLAVAWQTRIQSDCKTAAAWLGLATIAAFAYFVRQKWSFEAPGQSSFDWKFRPRPAWVLTAKAALSVLIALQLAYPILANIPFTFEPQLASLLRNLCQERAMCDASGITLDGQGSHLALFSSRQQEIYWWLASVLLIIIVHLLEYEWIIRPSLRAREDRVIDPSGPARWDDWQDDTMSRRRHRNLAELTLPWLVYKSWLPALSVSVNLGFDRLDHRQIIQAMLVGLRERYYRTFLAWNSGFANLGRFIGILVILMFVALVGGDQLELPGEVARGSKQPKQETWARILNADLIPNSRADPADPSQWDLIPSHPIDLIDRAQPSRGPGAADGAPRGYESGSLLVLDLLPHSKTNQGQTQASKRIHFRVYHILIFTALFLIGRWLLFKVPLLPYKENLRRIEDLLDSLSVRTRITSSLNLWGPARWVYSIFVDERVRETERDPVDPRTVELAFLQILEDLQKGGFRFPGAARHHLTMPAPEITFIFDELDKLGTRVDPGLTYEPSGKEQETKVLQQERERSIKLRALLSDLKNILASAPARFIFVGGRDLHDEWLADQTSRQPLLTSIFNTEVYLPSLITDQSRQLPAGAWRLHWRIEEYLFYQHKRAHHLHHNSVLKRWRPSFGLAGEALTYETFVHSDSKSGAEIAQRIATNFEVIDCTTGERMSDTGMPLLQEFVLFLTHRSMGNPKKLKDLLAGFIRPAGREIAKPKRWQASPCRHVLSFNDTEIFQIQLIVSIYRHLALAFEERMVRRDDKFAVSIFFLTDFLFKFHRRAFSWSNLERVDDLAHIHRLPDLRNLQEEIVNHFSERFLHRMLNGMYAFRFRSDIANEIEYLSRQSAAEMAALNFTLDESQSLKVEYEAALEGWEKKNADLVAGLGELYEFDQDFERARHAYRGAIELLDAEIKSLTAHLKRDSGEYLTGAPIHSLLAGKDQGPGDARLFLPWGAARLRLMLQIGMTFEHSRDLESAETEYRNARTLARALVRAYVDWEGRGEPKPEDPAARHKDHRLHSLKHMNIVFQPLFAEAWLSEKFVGSIDTSISLVERGLWELRRALPFVRSPKKQVAEYPAQTIHANFAVTLSQLHNKAGDVYFFKGRQPVDGDSILLNLEASPAEGDQPQPDRPIEGYLLRAHYHYALGLHELRRYVRQRVESSRHKLSISEPKERTLLPKAVPDLLFRAAAGGVNDMAEATLARVSLFSLLARLRWLTPEKTSVLKQDLSSSFEDWMSGDPATPGTYVDLTNWFGRWTESQTLEPQTPLIEFTGADPSEVRLAMSLKLCVVGASYFENGGYPEDAGRELLQVCETVTRYLWWAHAVEAIHAYAGFPKKPVEPWQERLQQVTLTWKKQSDARGQVMSDIFQGQGREFWLFLVNLAVHALEKADAMFRESRHERTRRGSTPSAGEYEVGELIPAEALTLLCSLGISGAGLLEKAATDRLRILLKRWTGSDKPDYKAVLVRALQRHRFPMINRLNGIKVLVDALVLRKVEEESCESLAQALEWTEELLDLNAQYDAPLHFTPLLSGSTYALLWLRWTKDDPEDLPAIEHIYRAAQRDLHNSEEMYTMRRAYYEAINDLYYLYDDFNDRQIHFNHAIQMAGAELTATLKCLVDLRTSVDDPFDEVAPSGQLSLSGV